MQTKTPKDIDEYIAGFPKVVQKLLTRVRATIRKAAPHAKEGISYKIPAFYQDGGYLIYFAGYKNHISVYPAPRGVDKFKKELAGYEGGKGTVRFPLDKPIPFDLITRIVKFRLEQNSEKRKIKKQ